MSITEQLITDSADFTMVTDLTATWDMEDIQTKPDRIQLANSTDDDDGMMDMNSDINSDRREQSRTPKSTVCSEDI